MMVLIDPIAQKPKRKGGSWYFKIKPSKIQEKIIDPDTEYEVVAHEKGD